MVKLTLILEEDGKEVTRYASTAKSWHGLWVWLLELATFKVK